MTVEVMHGDCRLLLPKLLIENSHRKIVIVTDPPFNIGYKYNQYRDRIKKDTYYNMLAELCGNGQTPLVMIHYPEPLHELSIKLGFAPNRVVAWVYNSNTARQHRQIGFWGVTPNFNQVRQPYKNLDDKRIKERIERGLTGAKLYDWWNVNQVKNVSAEKTNHPCQMPLEVMKNILGILPKDALIIDPFAGSGTTLVAAQELGMDAIGIELDKSYVEIARERVSG